MLEQRRESIRWFIGFVSGARQYSYMLPRELSPLDIIHKPADMQWPAGGAGGISVPTPLELHHTDLYDGGG